MGVGAAGKSELELFANGAIRAIAAAEISHLDRFSLPADMLQCDRNAVNFLYKAGSIISSAKPNCR